MCGFFSQAEDGIRDLVRSRGLGDVYKRQGNGRRARELPVEGRDSGLLGGNLGDGVLHHGVGGERAHRVAQLGELLHGQTAVLGEHGLSLIHI